LKENTTFKLPTQYLLSYPAPGYTNFVRAVWLDHLLHSIHRLTSLKDSTERKALPTLSPFASHIHDIHPGVAHEFGSVFGQVATNGTLQWRISDKNTKSDLLFCHFLPYEVGMDM
jgi:hypothetical protein